MKWKCEIIDGKSLSQSTLLFLPIIPLVTVVVVVVMMNDDDEHQEKTSGTTTTTKNEMQTF